MHVAIVRMRRMSQAYMETRDACLNIDFKKSRHHFAMSLACTTLNCYLLF